MLGHQYLPDDQLLWYNRRIQRLAFAVGFLYVALLLLFHVCHETRLNFE